MSPLITPINSAKLPNTIEKVMISTNRAMNARKRPKSRSRHPDKQPLDLLFAAGLNSESGYTL